MKGNSENAKKHRSKMVAPIVVTSISVVYYIVYFGVLIALLEGVWKFVLGIIPALLIGVTLMVCIERIKEIKKGEEDDLSKY